VWSLSALSSICPNKTICLLSSLLCACGPQQIQATAAERTCPLVTGTWTVSGTLDKAEGTCALQRTFTDTATFDSSGRLLSPLPGIVTCTTFQPDCALEIRCTAALVPGQLTLKADVYSEYIYGRADAVGDYLGCTRASYWVLLWR
jgi:hypothetical protein